jgi:hypothetical protein
MPPKQAQQPSADARQEVIDWVQAVRMNEARKNAGDPGPVMVRRLSNAEYNNTIRDLTGVDMRPTREFPVDPANTAGFDNSGESLTMSPALLNKYLQAAREVGDHMVLTPDGFDSRRIPCWSRRIAIGTRSNASSISMRANLPTTPTISGRLALQAPCRLKPDATLGRCAEAKVSAKYLPRSGDPREPTGGAGSARSGNSRPCDALPAPS